MSSQFHWGLNGLDLSKFMALANCLLLRNDGQVDADTSIPKAKTRSERRKRHFLDRFSEIASRERTPYQVTAAVMREFDGSVEIWVAKNAGFTSEDRDFLTEFERFMADPLSTSSSGSTFWDCILQYYRSRLHSYLVLLKGNMHPSVNAFLKYTSLPQSDLTTRVSTDLIDMAHMFLQFTNIPSKTYYIIEMIARPRRSHKTFVKFAHRYSSLKFLIKESHSMTVSHTGTRWTLSETFRHLGLLPPEKQLDQSLIQLYLGRTRLNRIRTIEDSTDDFRRIQNQYNLHCHVEIQLVLEILHSRFEPECFFPYIGCSKSSCYLCHTFLEAFGRFATRGCHMRIYTLWAIPPLSLSSTDTRDKIVQAILEVQEKISSRLKMPLMKTHWWTTQSTVGSASSPTVPSTIMPTFNGLRTNSPRQSAHTVEIEQIPISEFFFLPAMPPAVDSSSSSSTPRAVVHSIEMRGSVKDGGERDIDEAKSIDSYSLERPSRHTLSNASGRSTPQPPILVENSLGRVSLLSSAQSIVIPVIEPESIHPSSRSSSSSHRPTIRSSAQRDILDSPDLSARKPPINNASSSSGSSSSAASYRTIRNGAYKSTGISHSSRFTEDFEDPPRRIHQIAHDTPVKLKSHFSSDGNVDGPEEIIIKDRTPPSIPSRVTSTVERVAMAIASERGGSSSGHVVAALSQDTGAVNDTQLEPFSDSLQETSGRNGDTSIIVPYGKQTDPNLTHSSRTLSSLSISTDSIVDIRVTLSRAASLTNNPNHPGSKHSSTLLSSWQSLENTLLRWATLWSTDTLERALTNEMPTGQAMMTGVALTIWSMQTYKRHLRDGGCEVLYIPPNIAEVVDSAMSNQLIGDALAILKAWTHDVMKMQELPTRLLVLGLCRFSQPKMGKEKGYEWEEWIVHEIDVTRRSLTSYGTLSKSQLSKHATVKNWRKLTTSMTTSSVSLSETIPHVSSNVVRVGPLSEATSESHGASPCSHSPVIPAMWYNLLVHGSRGFHPDLERVQNLIWKDVKSLLVRKRSGHLINHA